MSIATGVSSACSTRCCSSSAVERIDQRLQLHAALADPLRQRRARDRQAGALEDALPAGTAAGDRAYLATSTWASSPVVGMPLSMMCAGTGACTSVSQLRADPLAADVALDGEHAGLVVQLLGHVLADALHRAAAAAGGVLGLVVDLAARQVRRQRLALGLLLLALVLARRA